MLLVRRSLNDAISNANAYKAKGWIYIHSADEGKGSYSDVFQSNHICVTRLKRLR